ncbi:TonB-dependent receptor [Pedobacter sp. MC2016-15]|uniref:TonB-dependent receptor n=1 Tax=Pedobacter sp. MC2016-15 TaxID=2994473 RepID=UPI00224611FC|nr:TonB-dependent receptor [Pedobacter sp. MC2016-15]MCX2479834.1 TonB-dependent receptor [Pedobacter sp. MC2016-15]
MRTTLLKLLTIAGISLGMLSDNAQAQTTTDLVIEGRVEDEKGKPVPNVSVRVEELKTSTSTDAQGHYQLQLKPGKYTLRFSFIGYKIQLKKADLTTESLHHFNAALAEDSGQLQNVEITGRKERSYKASGSFSGSKTETALRDIPQAISYVTKEVIEDQQAFRTIDLIKNMSGVNAFSTYDNDIVIRGFRASNSLINGLRTISNGWSSSLLPYVEKMEVIKGPASAMFANTDPGGTVNIITKKPLNEDRKSVMLSTGSYNTTRIATDFTGPIDSAKTFLYRLNLAYQNAGSFRVLQGSEDIVIAPSFSFIPDDKTKVNFEMVYSRTNGRLDRGQPIFGATAGAGAELLYSTPISFAIGKDNDFLKQTNLFSTISIQRKISDKLSINASYMKFFWKEDLMEHRTSNNYAVDAAGLPIPTLMEMRASRRFTTNNTDNLTLYGTYDLKTGPLTHKVLFGYDYIQSAFPKDNNSSISARGYRNAANTGTINSYNPANSSRYLIVNNRPVPNVPHFDLTNPDYSFALMSDYFTSATINENTPSKYYVNGVYIQDQVKWNKFQLLLALRKEYYVDLIKAGEADEQKVDQSALLPRVGLVFTPIAPLSIYGTYTESYQPQGAATVGNAAVFGGPFDPLMGKMIEGGVKMELFEKRLAINIAAYRIEEKNILINANDDANPDLLRQVGEQRSTGIETDIYGSVNANLSILANFSYNKAIITESDVAEEVGTLMPNAPRSQGNVWAKYVFGSRELKGLGIAIGSNYVTKRNTLNSALQLPGYTLVNAALSYSVKKFKMAVNFNNIFDKTHWIGGYDFNRLFPGTPRNYMTSIGYVF